MSTVRRDSAAARAAQARRRQRTSHSPGNAMSADLSANPPMTSPLDTGTSAPSRDPRLPPASSTGLHCTPASTSTASTPSTFQTARSTSDTPASSAHAVVVPSSSHTAISVVKENARSSSHDYAPKDFATRTAANTYTSTGSTTATPPLRAQNQVASAAEQRVIHKSVQLVPTSTEKRNSFLKQVIPQEEEELDSFLDLEPDQNDPAAEVIDAACLQYGSLVMLRPRSQPTTSLTIQREIIDESTTFQLARDGLSLGTRAETFQLVRLKGGDERNDTVVRYGDTLALRSIHAQRRALGARPVSAADKKITSYNIGCFRRTGGLPEQWTIRSSDHVLAVGRAAVESSSSLKPQRKRTSAVRSGECVVLRNKAAGGLLSLDSVGDGLTLLTHSYDTSGTTRRSSGATGLLDRLQYHDRMMPSPDELFQIITVNTPPCPLWTSSRSDRRVYLEGEHLFQVNRDHGDESRDEAVFEKIETQEGVTEMHGLAGRLLQNVTIGMQERMILDEVIGSLIGLEGRYICFDQGTSLEDAKFCISSGGRALLPSGLIQVIERILVLSSGFIRVRAFVASRSPGYEYGRAAQALCEALDEMLLEYVRLVGNIDAQYRLSDDPTFSMNLLYVYVQSPLHTMSILETVVVATRSRKGGALLNALVDIKTTTLAGDSTARQLLTILLEKASVPYMVTLNEWLRTGELQDAAKEFLVDCPLALSESTLRNPGGVAASYDGDVWKELFVLRVENSLRDVLTSKSVQNKVLMTGRYWNAVRICQTGSEQQITVEDCAFDEQADTSIEYGMDSVSTSTFIDKMYQSASTALLDLLLRDFQFSETLLALKRYFLLDQGDFLVHFLDAAEDELMKEADDVATGRVQNWITMSVHFTSPPQENNVGKKDLGFPAREPLSAHALTFKFASGSLVDELDDLHAAKGGIDARVPKTPSRHPYGLANTKLTGMEAFVLDFDDIPFPTSLVISRRTLQSYQLLFRHIYLAKHVERRLVGIWFDHQIMKELQTLRGALGPTYCLRQRMLHFMQNLIYYIMSEVVEPNWLEMREAISARGDTVAGINRKRSVRTVDDVINLHSEFLQRTYEECFLMNRKVVRSLTKLMTTCRLFSDQMKRFMEKTKISAENQLVANQKRNTVQRNLNDPDTSRIARSKKLMRKKMNEDREERARRLELQTVRVERELSNESYQKMIARYDVVFTDDLRDFMRQLQSSSGDQYHSWATLCTRLDYNGFVTGTMG